MQYTVRRVSKQLDKALRAKAVREGKSLNEVALEALERGMGTRDAPVRYRSLHDLCGRWKDDPEFDAAVADQHCIDPDLWA
jgi:hypothetical protein